MGSLSFWAQETLGSNWQHHFKAGDRYFLDGASVPAYDIVAAYDNAYAVCAGPESPVSYQPRIPLSAVMDKAGLPDFLSH